MTTQRQALYIIRGLPGAGKSTIAQGLVPGPVIEADQYFIGEDGVYRWDRSKRKEAHADCRKRVRDALAAGCKAVIVANTFTRRWQMQPYLDMGAELNLSIQVIDIFDRGLSNEELAEANVHSVPVEVIARMRERYEHEWWDANPQPPWER